MGGIAVKAMAGTQQKDQGNKRAARVRHARPVVSNHAARRQLREKNGISLKPQSSSRQGQHLARLESNKPLKHALRLRFVKL
jgi:hypothetical protein